jgi:predicted RNase H-like HicB family nuclease
MTASKDTLYANLFKNIDEALELHFNKLIELEQKVKALEAKNGR